MDSDLQKLLKLGVSTKNIRQELHIDTSEKKAFYSKTHRVKEKLNLVQAGVTIEELRKFIEDNVQDASNSPDDIPYVMQHSVSDLPNGKCDVKIIISSPKLVDTFLVNAPKNWCLAVDATYDLNVESK